MLAASAILSTAATAEIILAEDLSVTGYVDLFAADNDLPGDMSVTDLAEFELAFNYTTEPFFSTVELSFDGSDASFETAIIGYNVSENLVLSAGNILSYLGWEAYDATGLYQFSYAYRDFSPLYPAYAVGVAADYVTDDYSFGIWLGDSSDGDISVELMGKYTGIEGLTIFGAYADDPGYETFNVWASYATGPLTFAVEYVDVSNTDADDQEGYLAMVNYAFDNAAVTFRYSVEDTEGISDDWKLFTISPSYTFSDNLLGLIELSLIDGGSSEGPGHDYQWAVELIYTF